MDEIKIICEELQDYLDACCDLPLKLLGKEGITSKGIQDCKKYYKFIYGNIIIDFHELFMSIHFNDLSNVQIKSIIEDIFEIKPDFRSYYSDDYTNGFNTEGYYCLKLRNIPYYYIEKIKAMIVTLYKEDI
jgi:hypothetical protein